ncbi:MAG: transcription termination/antitermination factor NusG [Eubacterium sp.]|nr:transcription termination/antitermination factor NusG [Eubacterium sp.]MBQ8981551.1 transcription termination/antitermination factor NusG [Eubacterium sp.]MBR1530791.1 transcription termination/antitermination factor NusG [Eubacterium sp.]MBR2278027.1 transcription termination/antitermination factor NusG [Eubacterium sp.]
MEEAKWYVAHTFSGYENKVASDLKLKVQNRNLSDLIQEIVVPTETVVEVKDDGTKKEYERKIFPSYLLIKMVMTDDTWYVVRNTRGCAGFVGPEGKPVPLTEEEIKNLGVEKVSIEVNYAVGDLVNVIDGPLEGFSGTVETIDAENNSVQVIVSMFGRDTAVDFELDQLEKVND